VIPPPCAPPRPARGGACRSTSPVVRGASSVRSVPPAGSRPRHRPRPRWRRSAPSNQIRAPS
jgi:hypothetical protein